MDRAELDDPEENTRDRSGTEITMIGMLRRNASSIREEANDT